ncbi:sigma-70 family RNA polymerase sigma factor [Clostridium cellulovorans]|uniref:RNA polymerase, sigma-24 subunit, ECF subfamily n=1 Tax=Clostridium cellulovorans (strain ATCC 35296 / DSM 3052 / OCM 3 / 743B) TaxID=573061 RepID=D9SQE4_CLOC7|nr:sigma-70 family RNA polymerase sigma factor [Clostridium cellulovorans]ADL50211.1 RNA polymerase, sigma-24 subunit, ECF subfamily [Clostridium cellulovorans 743B]
MGVISYFKKKKDKQSLKNIYEEFYNPIYKKISYLTGDMHVAEDLTQEVFMKLYNSPPDHDNIAAWLNKVSTNISYNYIRDKKNHENKNEIIYEKEVSNIISIEEIAINNCEINLTRKVLNMLSPRDRMCLLLKFSGYKYSEIAETIKIDKNSVGTVISRAQAKFKENYLKAEEGVNRK